MPPPSPTKSKKGGGEKGDKSDRKSEKGSATPEPQVDLVNDDFLVSGRARRVLKGECPALILKMENAPCPFGPQRVAPCPFQNIKTLKNTQCLTFLSDLCYLLIKAFN